MFGAKAHIIYDPQADRPVYFAVTPAKVNDITAAKAMPIEAGATYVYDLGYYDYGWWADARRCRLPLRDATEEKHSLAGRRTKTASRQTATSSATASVTCRNAGARSHPPLAGEG